MAVSVETVRERIIAAIKGITPTYAKRGRVAKFHYVGDDTMPVAESAPSGSQERGFEVYPRAWQRGDIQHPGTTELVQTFEIQVMYPGEFDDGALHDLVAMDRHDITVRIESGEDWGTDVILWSVPEGPPPLVVEDKGLVLVVLVEASFLAPR